MVRCSATQCLLHCCCKSHTRRENSKLTLHANPCTHSLMSWPSLVLHRMLLILNIFRSILAFMFLQL